MLHNLAVVLPSLLLDGGPNLASHRRPNTVSLLQESEWEQGRIYQEDTPTYVHYFIKWRVTLDNKTMVKDTEENLVLAPNAYWRLFL
jgi:hypothetical protein